ncbi:MAG: hypothetical protein JOY65_09400 [Acetobacteraceae bacterium]|nr:hypothetical protein [Acetobacteraceae bacterium]
MEYSQRRRPGAVEQPDLFTALRSRSAGRIPTWETLPVHTRTELTGLMIRLILEHARGRGAMASEEARHDR